MVNIEKLNLIRKYCPGGGQLTKAFIKKNVFAAPFSSLDKIFTSNLYGHRIQISYIM
jgi:hypothetical protein